MKKRRSKKYQIIQTLRILSQILFFGIFLYLLVNTHFPGEDYIGKVEIFFHFDPLLALVTILASRTVFLSFIFASLTLILTFVMGRVVCGWVCPLGSIHQFFSFLFKKSRLLRPKKAKDNHTVWKYYLLAILLVCSLLTLDLVGILDPLSLLYRSFTISILPSLDYSFNAFLNLLYKIKLSSFGDNLVQFFKTLAINPIFHQGFFIGIIFISLVLLNVVRERFWCRFLCPLGAFLGICARWNVLKLRIDEKKCIECGLCNLHCETQANPFPEDEWRSPECVYCFTCSSLCPTSAISFPMKSGPEEIQKINFSRRRLILTSLLGVIATPFFRLSPGARRASPRLIRPPGALSESTFLQKCVKCGQCMKVCPTNALQPALGEAGAEGIWTPILVPKIGYCEYYCSLCSQVCPTGAIQELTVEQKLQTKIGTAWVDKNRCIPYNLGTPCIVCEEHCPTSPKAIKLVETAVKTPEGSIKTPKAPHVDQKICIGCGICENKCPVVDSPAIYVTSVGESRSEQNQMLLDLLIEEEIQ